MKKLTVEQIENNIARCENDEGGFENICLSDFPFSVKSGDIISFDGKEYKLLEDEAEKRKKKLLSMQANLFKK